MAGVDADANAGMILGGDLGDNVAEFGQGAAYCRALAAHGFEDGDYGCGCGEGISEGLGESRER